MLKGSMRAQQTCLRINKRQIFVWHVLAPTFWQWESIWSTRCRPRRNKGPWQGSTRHKLSHIPHNGVKTSVRRPGPSQGTAVAVGAREKSEEVKYFIFLRGGTLKKVSNLLSGGTLHIFIIVFLKAQTFASLKPQTAHIF